MGHDRPDGFVFPWIVLALDVRSPPLQFAAITRLGAAWMLGYFYPPMFISLAFAGGAIFVALHFRRDRSLVIVIPEHMRARPHQIGEHLGRPAAAAARAAMARADGAPRRNHAICLVRQGNATAPRTLFVEDADECVE